MTLQNLIVFLLVGVVAGFLAGRILKGSGFGALGNLIIGVIGAILGGVLFALLGLRSNNILGDIVTATIGAIVLIFLLSLVGAGKRRR